MDKRLVDAKYLAGYISKSREAIYQMVSRRQIPFVKIGGRTMFDLEQIHAWIRKHTINPTDIERREAEL